MAVQGKRRLVGTGAAAAAVGVDPATLWRWERAGRVKAELRTAGGQLRWDIDRLRAQLPVDGDGVGAGPEE